MRKNEEIFLEVYNILEEERKNGILNYVKKIFQGVREDIVNFPVIILEPDIERETIFAMPLQRKGNFTILITCWLEIINKDQQIIGSSAGSKGVLDLVDDIKETLWKYPNLNGKCLKFQLPIVRYIFETYPFRGAEITMEIEYN